MPVKVLYFASLRERRGCAEEAIDIEPGLTVGALMERLFPASEGPIGPVAFARNKVLVRADAPIADGDEIALLPPVGGG